MRTTHSHIYNSYALPPYYISAFHIYSICPQPIDIIVEFVPQQYTVTEDGDYVVVTVRATGFPEAPFDMVDNITVMLFTVDGSALGKFY